MKKQILMLAGLAIFNTCISQTNNTTNQVLGGGNSSALDFDGVDDYVTTSTVLNSVTFSNWTIECWAKSPSAPTSSLGMDGPIYGENAGIVWNHNSSTFQGVGMVRTSNGTYYSASFGGLLPDTWYHLAVTYDGNLLKAYRNGTLITTTSTSFGGMINSASQLFFGRHPTQLQFWQGSLDNVRIWSTARTCEQITDGLNQGSILNGSGLISHFMFNDGVTNGTNTSITTLQNLGNNTNDATLSGFALTGSTSNFVASAPFNLPLVCVPSSGLPANSLSFGGANDLVVVPNSTPFTDYTIECNVLLNSLADQNIIVATNASGTFASASHQLKLINGQFVHYMYDGNLRTLTSTATVTAGQWFHVAIYVSAGQTMGINVDGLVDTYPSTVDTPWQLLTEFRFGGSAMGVGDFNGKLDEVRIWDRVLSAFEIQNASNCEVAAPANGLRSVFHFNQGIEIANNAGIDSLFADNSSLVGTLVGFALDGSVSNWDDVSSITSGNTCSGVGINDIKIMKNELLVYPNPAQDKLTIKAEGKYLKVINSLGVVVLTSDLKMNSVELKLNELSSGVYHIVTDMGAHTKFIKQ